MELADYFANQFRRFAGADEVLQWDEFWRLQKDLDLGAWCRLSSVDTKRGGMLREDGRGHPRGTAWCMVQVEVRACLLLY